MKIKINVVNDHEETSVQDEDYLGQQVHTIGQPVHVGDVLLIKVRNKLFKCEVQDSEAYKSSISLFSVKIYPLDEDDKKLFEKDEYRIVKKRDYMDGTLNFYKEIKHKNGDAYWEIDFTKGDIQFEWPTDTFVKAFDEIPFTVVKFLTKSVPSSVVQDNDLTEYRNSIKPDYVKRPYFFKETHIVGNPVHVGDVLLIKVKDKLFKCEIVDKKIFDKAPNLFSANFYPLDEDNKAAFENTRYHRFTKKNYLFGAIKFDKEIKDENGDTYWEFDFTKGIMNLFPIINGFEEFSDQPFTVVKFLTKSVPSSAVQDNDLTEYKPSIKPLKEDYRNVFNPSQAIGEPVEDGDTFLIEAADKSFKCEIHETDDLFKNQQNLFTARIYPLDKDDVSIAYEDYFEVVLMFDQHLENHDHYVIDFTKGKISPVDYIPIIREDTPFTVTKFLAHSGKNSTVQDADITEYRNSIKPHHIEHAKVSFIGNPVHPGDVLLIKAEDKLFKCEIQYIKHFSESPTLFSVKIYPLDKDDKNSFENDKYHTITKRKYISGLIDFDENVKHENGDTYYEIDFAKGILQSYWSTDILGSAFDEVPFTVVKFLTRSIPASTVQDSGVNLNNLENDISEDLNNRFSNLYFDCIDFTYLLEDYEKAIEKIIYNDEPSHEYDDEEDPKDREYKDYLEKVAFSINDVIYCLDDLKKEIRKR